MSDMQNRFLGAMFGLAYGDAISFPALFHRFAATPKRRNERLWMTNLDLYRRNISRLTLPYTHRDPSITMEPCPTDDTEFALLTLKALVQSEGEPTQETFLAVWQQEILPRADEVRSSFSERAAIENLQRGLLPPATGNDNPLHFENCAVARAVPIGLFSAGNPTRAAQLAALDAQITQAEDGIYAAQAMAAAIAVLAGGGTLEDALTHARQQFPADSWIAHVDRIARECLQEADTPDTLALLLTAKVINTVYTYGDSAPETLPAALVLIEKCAGQLQASCLNANLIPKSADSLPAIVGALCGCYQGMEAISPAWRKALAQCRGLCLPFLAGVDLAEYTNRLYERSQHRVQQG